MQLDVTGYSVSSIWFGVLGLLGTIRITTACCIRFNILNRLIWVIRVVEIDKGSRVIRVDKRLRVI